MRNWLTKKNSNKNSGRAEQLLVFRKLKWYLNFIMSERFGIFNAILTVALILAACAILPTFGKGFDANGEKDNGKCKWNSHLTTEFYSKFRSLALFASINNNTNILLIKTALLSLLCQFAEIDLTHFSAMCGNVTGNSRRLLWLFSLSSDRDAIIQLR